MNGRTGFPLVVSIQETCPCLRRLRLMPHGEKKNPLKNDPTFSFLLSFSPHWLREMEGQIAAEGIEKEK